MWAVLAIVVYLSQRADGASWSLLMAGAQAMLTGLVFILAIRHGEGGLCATDVLLTAVAGAGVAGWVVPTSRSWPPRRSWRPTCWPPR